MNKFNVGDKVIIKSTIGSANEVVKIVNVGKRVGEWMYLLSDKSIRYEDELVIFDAKTDLEGGYKMKEISMDKKYKTRDGRDVEIITINSKLNKPIVGIVDGETHTRSWYMNGLWSFLEDDWSQFDLMEVNPYADFKVDDKVLVTNRGCNMWRKAHFCKVDAEGKVVVFDDGGTSYTKRVQGKFKYYFAVKCEDRTDDMVICDD